MQKAGNERMKWSSYRCVSSGEKFMGNGSEDWGSESPYSRTHGVLLAPPSIAVNPRVLVRAVAIMARQSPGWCRAR